MLNPFEFCLHTLILLACLRLLYRNFRAANSDNSKTYFPFRRKAKTAQPKFRPMAAKPDWVRQEVLRLIAIMHGKGCRTIANVFNARNAKHGQSVSKTYVSELRRDHAFELLKIRRNLQKPPRQMPANTIWAIDYTEVRTSGVVNSLIAVIDHGSRKLLKLTLCNKTAASALIIISELTKTFGKPKVIRTDNDGSFVSREFKAGMQKLGIRHHRTNPHSPWENGIVERFFGTLKSALCQIHIDTAPMLKQAIDEFCFFYNHIRQHQNLGGRTPNMAWSGKNCFPAGPEPSWFSAWNGILCGWYWRPPNS
jgi:putative transposase